MLVRKYKNFEEMFYSINREILLNPELIDYTNINQGLIYELFVACKSYDCNLNLGDFAYRKAKWGHLLNSYVDYETLLEFKKGIVSTSSLSITFYFKQKKAKTSSKSNSNPCLVALIFTRKARGKPFDKVNVICRTSELSRKLAADLVLINRFINELPKDIVQIDRVYFYYAQAYCNALLVNAYLDYFDLNIKDLKSDNKFINTLQKHNKKYFISWEGEQKYLALKRMQKFYFKETKYPEIKLEDLSISEFFENKRRK